MQILADEEFHPSPAPAFEPPAVPEKNRRIPQSKRDSHLRGGIPTSRGHFQKSSGREDPSILGSLASHFSILPESLRKANNLLARGVARKRRANEMVIAREVQRKLLPQHLPPLETLDYAGSCEPAWTVGGDYYDFLEKGKGRVGFVLADVSGKGVSAALLMANLQASVRSQYAVAHEELEGLFRSVNKLFYESVMSGFFATLFFAEVLRRNTATAIRQLRTLPSIPISCRQHL